MKHLPQESHWLNHDPTKSPEDIAYLDYDNRLIRYREYRVAGEQDTIYSFDEKSLSRGLNEDWYDLSDYYEIDEYYRD